MKKSIHQWILCVSVTLFLFQPNLMGQAKVEEAVNQDHRSLLEEAANQLQNAPEKALELALKVLDDKQNTIDSTNLSVANLLAGEAYFKQRNYEKAELLYKNAFNMFNKLEDKNRLAVALNNMAKEYGKQGLIKKSKQFYHLSKDAYKNLNADSSLAILYFDLGTLEQKYGDMWAAHEYYRFSLDISENLSNEPLLLKTYKTIADLYAKQNYYKNAYNYFVKWTNLRDSIQQQTYKNEISGIKTRFEKKESQLEQSVVDQKNELQAASKRKINWMRFVLILCGSLLLVAIVMLIALLVNKSKTKRLLGDKYTLIEDQDNRIKSLNNSQREMNKELRLLEKAYKETYEAREKLINVITLDVTNSFNSIKRNSLKLKEDFGSLTDEQRMKLIEENNTEINSTQGLTENILLWANIQRGKLRFNGRQAKIKPVMEAALNKFKDELDARDIQSNVEVMDNQDAFCDVFFLENIMKNILNFLRKYDIDGSVINISAYERIKYLEICIENIGSGKLPENLNQLFSKENSPSATDKKKKAEHQDRLLELQICKQFVELSGGNIWVTSLPGAGNKFCFTLQKSGPAYLHQQKTAYNRINSTVA